MSLHKLRITIIQVQKGSHKQAIYIQIQIYSNKGFLNDIRYLTFLN